MKRVGLLGGAFNPPHEAHLKLASLALEHLDLDELRFVPTALSPHKPTTHEASDAQRLGLLKAALEGCDPRVRIDTIELDRGGTSYTADTLEALSQREPDSAWILIVGSDQLPGLMQWRRAEDIFRLASIAIAERPGVEALPPVELPLKACARWSGAPGERVPLPSTGMDLASTRLRDQLRHNRVTSGLPAPVKRLIETENLYK